MSERLHKVLARSGLGSRRTMERWIAARRVSVNGKIAELGVTVEPRDRIRVDGQLMRKNQLYPTTTRIIVLNKPVGLICARSDPGGRPSVFSVLPKGVWISVGRLDINSGGLLLFTNNGDLAHSLMHPSRAVEREYEVRVMGKVTEKALLALKEGVQLDDGVAAFASIETRGGEGLNQWCRVTLKEGRKREVRRLFESQGLKVNRLLRVRYGSISLLRGLLPGQWRGLDAGEVEQLMQLAGLSNSALRDGPQKKKKAKSKAKTQLRTYVGQSARTAKKRAKRRSLE